jgi:hypothetical protein
VVTNKVKELLLSHNTGQKLFGEAVLGLSQVGVSYFLFLYHSRYDLYYLTFELTFAPS